MYRRLTQGFDGGGQFYYSYSDVIFREVEG